MKLFRLGVKGKVTAVFASMGILLSAIIGYAVYSFSYNYVVSQYIELARSSATMAANTVSDYSMEHYLQNPGGEDYITAYEKMREIKSAYKLTYLYIFIPDVAKDDGIYVFDIFTEENDPEMIASPGEPMGESDYFAPVREIYLTGSTENNAIASKTEYGYLTSAYVPVYGPGGAITAVSGVDISMDVILGDVYAQTFGIMSIAIGIIALFLVLLMFIISKGVLRPIVRLSRHMGSFTQDGEFSGIAVAPTGDEIQEISESFNRMAGDLKLYMENLAAVTADRERIAAELDVAKDIQRSMLPCIFPPFPERSDFDIYASMTPAREVGGDFYDFYMLDGNRLCLTIADVSGKGVPAALFMVIAKTLLKNQASVSETPAEILASVNNQLCESNDASLFVTVFIGVLELDTGLFTYSNAGHCRPLISRGGGAYEWLSVDSGFVLAGLPDIQFENESLTLRPGDRLFLYTDGIPEAQNNDEELWGDDRLKNTLNRPETSGMPPEGLLGYVFGAVSEFAGGAEQFDDVTMLTLRLNEKSE